MVTVVPGRASRQDPHHYFPDATPELLIRRRSTSERPGYPAAIPDHECGETCPGLVIRQQDKTLEETLRKVIREELQAQG